MTVEQTNSELSTARELRPESQSTLAYVLPFAAMSVASLFAVHPLDTEFDVQPFRFEYGRAMTWFVGAQLVLMLAALGYGIGYVIRTFPVHIHSISVWVGAVGVLLWIGICNLHFEKWIFERLGLTTWVATRSGFNPFHYLDGHWAWLIVFLFCRFLVLAICVPIAEEWLIRGWGVRWWDEPNDWPTSDLRQTSQSSLWLVIAYAVLTHPQEFLAAIVWFALINWLMKRTGNLWDCVAAHAITNGLLGLYILCSEDWNLW